MKNRIFLKVILAVFFLMLSGNIVSQEERIEWNNPAETPFPVIEGKGWSGDEIGLYSRLPKQAKATVRPSVWRLAQNSAGLSVRFKTNSEKVVVRYKVSGGLSMFHMPTTGVSGLDLYALEDGDSWGWQNGKYDFADTIKCDFSPLSYSSKDKKDGHEYRLYLPLYNSLQFIEIGVSKDSNFKFLPAREEDPIVIYGTSIVQGACASRPGLAWTNILSRKLNQSVVNFGFSGNGEFEEEVIQHISEIDASLYVLDCLPNMTPFSEFPPEETYDRIVNSVEFLKRHKPEIPVLLVEHSGYSDGAMEVDRKVTYKKLNSLLEQAYDDLINKGVTQLFYLSREELNLDVQSYVDGTHPNDLGMMQYADAYEARIRKVRNTKCDYEIKVMSYNIHYSLGADGEYDLERIAEVMKKEDPDIVGLQEIGDSVMSAKLEELTGMEVVFGPSLGKMDGYGDAILSKHPFTWVGNYSIPSASSSRYQAMAVDVDLSDIYKKKTNIRFVNTHFDWLKTLGSEAARLAAVDVIEEGFFSSCAMPAILTGDLNAIPESEPLNKLKANGWINKSMGKTLYTIPSSNPTKQIDYILFRPQNHWEVIDVKVLDEPVASDHLPIVMTLIVNRITN